MMWIGHCSQILPVKNISVLIIQEVFTMSRIILILSKTNRPDE